MLDLPLRSGAPEAEQDSWDALRSAPAAPAPSPRGAQRRRRRVGRRLLLLGLLVATITAVVAYLVVRPSPPIAGFSPELLDFGRQRVGNGVEPKTLTVTNIGERPMAISGIKLGGENADDYQVVDESCSVQVLQPRQSCIARLRFAPADLGPRTAALELHAEMPDSPARLALNGIGVGPRLGVDSATLSFSPQDVTTVSGPIDLRVRNDGTATLEISAVSVAGQAPDDFRLVLNQCSRSSLEPGQACDLRLAFTPQAAGARKAELEIRSDALPPVPTVTLIGEGVWRGATLAAEPEVVDFGRQLLGAPAQRQRLRLVNRQAGEVGGLSLRLDAADTGFAIADDQCSRRSLAPGDDCRVDVVFEPRAEGRFADLLRIRYGDAGGLDVELKAQAVAPRWVMAREALEFAATRVEQASGSQTIDLRNEGSAAAKIVAVELSGGDAEAFRTESDGCTGRTIGPQEGCSVAIRFRPRREGPHRAELRLRAAAGGEPRRVTLVASAVAPRLGLDREVVDFGSVHRTTAGRVQLTASNRGTDTLTLRGLAIAGGAGGDFRVQGGTCAPPLDLRPGESCVIGVLFAPASDGRLTASLAIEHDGVSGPRELPLAGVGLPPPVPELSLEPREVDFGPQPVGERTPIVTILIHAGGTGRLEFAGFSLAGPQADEFHIVPATCEAAPFLLPGSDCAIGVRFIPAAPGPRRGRLVIRHNAAAGTSAVDLRGEGLGGSAQDRPDAPSDRR